MLASPFGDQPFLLKSDVRIGHLRVAREKSVLVGCMVLFEGRMEKISYELVLRVPPDGFLHGEEFDENFTNPILARDYSLLIKSKAGKSRNQ